MSIIEKLTEGIISRNVQKEGQALLGKWEKTGLLEGIEKDQSRQTMACLLENQAKELLREASTMGGTTPGDVEGFAAVAFPIVRRVFGGLIANELVSVQPMSLPSGLIFFLDFTYEKGTGANDPKKGASIYGGGVAGREITGGVDLGLSGSNSGFYNLNNGYASATGSVTVTAQMIGSGTFGGGGRTGLYNTGFNVSPIALAGVDTQDKYDALFRNDPNLISGTSTTAIWRILTSSTCVQTSNGSRFNFDDLVALSAPSSSGGFTQLKWLTRFSGTDAGALGPDDNHNDPGIYLFYANNSGGGEMGSGSTVTNTNTFVGIRGLGKGLVFPIVDNFAAGGDSNDVGSVVGQTDWALESNAAIAEIDIKVDSVSITAVTKKLKAKWTPELQQDINAYHNLDAEVELTGILSEQIALEIDQEILEDLVKGSTAGTYYWSRRPGKFVQRSGQGLTAGTPINTSLHPDFTGTVSEWYETLLETVNDVSANIHRKTLRGGANFIVTSPEVANVLEFTAGFRADTTADENKGTAGAVKVGAISKKWDIYVDPYFPRNLLLVGRKGSSFLESGYVYAPYVPLQVTPTIFGTEDFVPRKGVMTRYGKKMVRPDMYGLVVVEDLV